MGKKARERKKQEYPEINVHISITFHLVDLGVC